MEYTGQATSRFRFADILYEKKDGVGRVTLNRPEVYNAYSSDTLREMTEAFRDAALDDSLGVLVLTGAGDKAFCAGSDAEEFSREFLRRPRNYWKYQGLLSEALNLFRHLGKPTIARLNGVVAGGGNDWNLAADLAVAADHVRFMQVGTRVGLVDAWGATQWLPLVVGERRAREMLLTCDEVTADQALGWGLVNQVVPLKQLDRAVNALAKKLIQKFPECTRYTRQQLDTWKDLAWTLTTGHAREWLTVHSTSWEPYEGIQAFVEKRPADTKNLRELAAAGKSSEFLWGAPTKTCENCGAKGIPERFDYCGKCGNKLK
ncbi:MAG: enoyl-CoA hydratase/isomerase family protein [Acidobacteriia bacterium]|jgi:enoyl-CoA hydratase/carnithine racemase|nr:enoyl-CoA hydratase/isomerase family protein [Terriglobia bacterium]